MRIWVTDHTNGPRVEHRGILVDIVERDAKKMRKDFKRGKTDA